jgi:7-cyano-7-deazaguanine synthase
VIVVLASGGVDSAVLAHRANAAGKLAALVWCNYGQPACLPEWRAMMALARSLSRPKVHEVPLTTVWAGAMLNPAGQPGARVVPVRNLLMLAHAINYAASIGAEEVQFGAIADDQPDYVDCRPEFVASVSGMAAPWGIRVTAPLVGMSKAAVIAEARARGVLDGAWSCYTPTPEGRPCGTCSSCVSRNQALVPCGHMAPTGRNVCTESAGHEGSHRDGMGVWR